MSEVQILRSVEIHFYEWSVSRWIASESRACYTLAARGLYRECLDLCYATGSIPRDLAILAPLCHASAAEVEELWPSIERHFHPLKNDKNRLGNHSADMFRRAFFRFKRDQKAKGKLGGRPKSKEDNKMKTTGFQEKKPREAKLSSKLREEKLSSSKAAAKPPPQKFTPIEGAPTQQSRRRTPEEIDRAGSLIWGASEGSPVSAAAPDKSLAESVLNACGSIEVLEEWLAKKLQQGKRPRTSYQYWVTLACAEFVDGRRA